VGCGGIGGTEGGKLGQRIRTEALFASVLGDAVEEFCGFGGVVGGLGGICRRGVGSGAIELDVADGGDVDVLLRLSVYQEPPTKR